MAEARPGRETARAQGRVRVVRLAEDGKDLPLTVGGGRARAVVGPHVGARERAFLYVELPEGSRSVELRHPFEAVYYVVRGSGQVRNTDGGDTYVVREGEMIYVKPGQGYALAPRGGAVVYAGGPCPPDPALIAEPDAEVIPWAAAAHPRPSKGIRILDPAREGVPMPMIARRSALVVSPHMGANYAVMNVVELEPAEKNVPHLHSRSEDSLFILSGSGWAHDLDAETRLPLAAGCAVIVPPGVRHTVEAGPEGLKSIGGPVPPDLEMMRAMGLGV